jgi:AraC-like DNA-binding protein
MIKELFKYSMFMGALLGVCFLIYTTFSNKRKDKSVIFLNLFVFFLTANNLQITLFDYGYVDFNFFVRKLLIPWYALIIPAFYTFITHYLRVEKKIFSLIYFSCFLFGLQIIIRLVLVPFYFHDTSNYIVAKYAQLEEIVNAAITLFIFGKIIFIFYNQSKLYSYIASYDNMKWLRQFLLLGGFILLLWVMAIVVNIQEVLNPSISIYYPLRFSSSFLLYWIAYQGFFHYNLMTERIELRDKIKKELPSQPPLPLIDTEAANNQYNQIRAYILAQNDYLKSDYSLEYLASQIDKNPKGVSKIIKAETGLGFPDYINSLRVQKAEKLLLNPNYSHYTIISIGLECGFNSKSTFYRSFSKYKNCTPTEFKKQNQA